MPQHRPTHVKRTHARQVHAKQLHAKRERQITRGKSGISTAPSNGETLLTRRNFLFGALGVGAVAAVVGGAIVSTNNANAEQAAEKIEILKVPADAVFASENLPEATPPDECMNLIGSFDLPYGTLLWTNNDSLAACLLPTPDSANPLTQVALLSLDSGQYPIVLDEAVGQAQGFDIYDVRASESGLIWTEANILDGVWRIYSATLSQGALGTPALIDEGDSDWETPAIAAVGTFAFWQVLPSLDGTLATSNSLLKRTPLGSKSAPEIVLESIGRMCTPPYALKDSLVITPRAATTAINHQLTLIDAASGEIRDKLALPNAMKPLEAGYGTNGFTFSFDGSYQYGDGISRLGTYTPAATHNTQDYADLSWFLFSRTPSAAPSWCGKYFIVKSNLAVCGIDLAERTYFALPTENGCDTYGDYLASTGETSTVVTFTNIDDRDISGTEKRLCRVRVWKPIS